MPRIRMKPTSENLGDQAFSVTTHKPICWKTPLTDQFHGDIPFVCEYFPVSINLEMVSLGTEGPRSGAHREGIDH